jgi:uncharacterized membrane protein
MKITMPLWVWAIVPFVIVVFARRPDYAAAMLGGIFNGLFAASSSIIEFIGGVHPPG